jgi:hypothetical protein
MTEPTAWEPGFEFYEARLGDDRLVVLLDLNVSQHAPVLTHPCRLEVMVPMLEPRPDGLRSSEEARRSASGGTQALRALGIGLEQPGGTSSGDDSVTNRRLSRERHEFVLLVWAAAVVQPVCQC